MLEVVEVGRVDLPAGEDAEVRGVEHLHAHVGQRAAGHHVQLQVAQAARGDGVPGAHAEGGRVGGEPRHGGPDPPQPHREEQGAREHVALERPHGAVCHDRSPRISRPRAAGVDSASSLRPRGTREERSGLSADSIGKRGGERQRQR
jgi:hypothetical protein